MKESLKGNRYRSGQGHAGCNIRRHVVIMAKAPRMGRVKTRLGRQIGEVAATYFFRHAARGVMLRLSRDPRWRTVLALTPDSEIATPAWPLALARMEQGPGGLGTRMQRIFDSPARGSLLIIGTDIPEIEPAQIAAAFRKLGAGDAVFGPAQDGGYWLVGLKRMPRVLRLFDEIRWSSAHALADTLANLAGHKVGFAGTLSDVDDARGFMRMRGWAGRVVLPAKMLR